MTHITLSYVILSSLPSANITSELGQGLILSLYTLLPPSNPFTPYCGDRIHRLVFGMHIFARSKSFQLVRKVNTLSICLASYRESHRRYKRATLNRFKCMVSQEMLQYWYLIISQSHCPLIIEKLANVDAVVQTYIS